MTNEEIAMEATKQLQDEGILSVWREYYSLVEYDKYAEDQRKEATPIILAAINRAQSEDKARLDWLEKENPYLWVNTFQGQTWRDKIDAARKHEA